MEHQRPPEELNELMLKAAKEYLRLGYRPIPVVPGTKQPATFWKEFQTRFPTEEEVEHLFGGFIGNIALVTGLNVVVVDVDDPSLLDQIIDHCGDTPMKCQTPKGGVHLWFRTRAGVDYGNKIRMRGMSADMRCLGSTAMVPWSTDKNGVPYKWLGEVLPPSELPLLKVSWLRDRRKKPDVKSIVNPSENIDQMIRRARGYLATIEGTISGEGGCHARTFRASCKMTHPYPAGFGLTPEQALPLMVEWSEASCVPPWSIKELEHKLRDAYRIALGKKQ